MKMENDSGQLSPVPILKRNDNSNQISSSPREKNDISFMDALADKNKYELATLAKLQQQLESENQQQCNINISCIRDACRNVCISRSFYFLELILLFIFLSMCLMWDPTQQPKLSSVTEIIEMVCHCLLIACFFVRVIQWENQKVVWLFLDITTSIAGIIGYLLVQQSFSEVGRYFKAYRALKIIFIIKQLNFFFEPAQKLMKSLVQASNILIPAMVITYIYAVIGLYSFSDLEYNKCRDPANLQLSSNWTSYTEEIYLCGVRQCPIINSTQYKCLNPIDYGVEPNKQELRNIDQGYGLLHYENIFYAFLSTIKQFYITGSSRLIILYKQAIPEIYVVVYYYTFIYFISYIYLNIFFSQIIVAQQISERQSDKKSVTRSLLDFDRGAIVANSTQKSEKRSLKYIKKPQKKIEIEALDDNQKSETSQIDLLGSNFTKKITINKKNQNHYLPRNAENHLEIPPYTSSQQYKQTISPRGEEQLIDGKLVLKNARVYNIFGDVDNKSVANTKDEIVKLAEQSVGQQEEQQISATTTLEEQRPRQYTIYQIINNVIVVLCCLNLSLDFHGQDPQFKYIVDGLDFGFYCLFCVEVVIKICWERMVIRRIEHYTKLEIGIWVLCTCGVLYEAVVASNLRDFISASDLPSNLLRSFKYLRIMLALLRGTFFKETRIILESIFSSLWKIKNVIGLWFCIVLLFGIAGFHLHSYRTKIDQDGNLSDNGKGFQISFDGIFNSIIFTMLTFYNEEWDYLMFQQYLGGGVLVVIWQLLSITIGLVLFSKYFMAELMVKIDEIFAQNYQNQQKNFSNFIKQDKQEEDVSQTEEDMNQKINDSNNLAIRPSIKTKKKSSYQQPIEQQNPCFLLLRYKIPHVVKKVVEHLVYKIFFGLFIAGQMYIVAALNPHIDRSSSQVEVYLIIDKFFKAYFMLDLTLNLIAFGVCKHENSYFLRSYLSWLNVVIIIIEIISFTPLGQNYIFLKIEKIIVLRILYLLEMQYKRDWNMRMTFLSFVQLLPKVISLLAVTILMYSFFALILVKVYKNYFFSCSDYYPEASQQIKTKWDCYQWGGNWIQMSINTSNLFNSTLFLFLVATTEGWITLMQQMMNFVGENYQPVLDSNKYICIFFVCFFFFGNLIMLNVFVGLSVTNFKFLRQIITGEAKLSKEERQWLSIKTQIYELEPLMLQKKPDNPVRGIAYRITTHIGYKIFQGIIFISFLVSMSLYRSNMGQQQRKSLQYTQYAFIGVLLIEYILEFLAFGIRKDYLRIVIFKNIALIYGIIYAIVLETTALDMQTKRILGGIFIALQLIRYLSLLDEIPFVMKLLNYMVTVLPRTSNILLMMFVTVFIYSIIGMELFAFLKPSTEIDEFNQNYTEFFSAIFALIKFSTMESPINQISDAAQQLHPGFICNEISSFNDFQLYGQTGCGSKAESYIFFLSFHVFYSLLLMATFMAIITDSYRTVKEQSQAPITKFVLIKVQKAWSRYDPQASGFIAYRQFWMFTAQLMLIYAGVDNQEKAQNQFRQLFGHKEEFLKSMAIPIYQNQQGVLCFQLNEVIEALTKVYLKENMFASLKSKKADKMFKERQAAQQIGFKKSKFTSSHVATLIVLKSGLKHWRQLALNEKQVFLYKNAVKKFIQVKK